MNILVICKRHYTNKDVIKDKFGRLYHFPAWWAKAGHNVTVLALDYRSFRQEKHLVDGVVYNSIPFPSFVFNTISSITKLAKDSAPTVIIASGDSYIGYWGLRLAKQLGTAFVFDLYHDYRDFGSNRLPGMKTLFNRACRQADLVVCDSSALAAKVGDLNKNTAVMPQGVDTGIFHPLDRRQAREHLHLDHSAIYIGYTGSISFSFDYSCLINAVEKLRQSCDTRLLLAGRNLANFDFDKPYINYLQVLPQSEMPWVIAACNVVVIPYKDTRLSNTCNPCKLTEYIACQRPLVVADISDVTSYLSHPESSVYQPSNCTELQQKIQFQLDTPTLNNFSEEMLWDNIARAYLQRIQGMEKTSGL